MKDIEPIDEAQQKTDDAQQKNEGDGMVIRLEDLDQFLPASKKSSAQKKEKPPKQRGPKKFELHNDTVAAMLGQTPVSWPPFHVKFHVQADAMNALVHLEEDPVTRTVRYVDRRSLADAVVVYWHEVCLKHERPLFLGHLNHGDALKVAAMFEARAPRLPRDIPAMAWKSSPGLAFNRALFDPFLPPDFDLERHCPLFNEMFSRFSNATALKLWIGSIFQPGSDLQQYVWIYGGGRNGKGALMRQLAQLLGSAATSQQVPKDGDRFWTWGLLGKRLALFADCNEYSWVTSGLFKQLTGGDGVRIEVKAGPVFSATMSAKFLFSSNNQPAISSQESDLRRIIYVEAGELTDPYPGNYEADLSSELPLFISHCWAQYHAWAGGEHWRQIPCDRAAAEDLASENEEWIAAFVDKYFMVHVDNPATAFKDKLHCSVASVQEAFKAEGITASAQQRRVKAYLKRTHKVDRHRVKIDGQLEWRYVNMTKKIYTFIPNE